MADDENSIDALAGQKIISVWVAPEQSSLVFVCEGDFAIKWTTEADCCSESWFADIVGVEALLGASVVRVEAIDMESIGYSTDDGRCRQEHDEVYGYKILTSKGWADIVFRNSSNGYYGGSMSVSSFGAKDGFAPMNFDQWVMIRDDWSADASDGKATPQRVPAWIALRESKILAQAAREPKPKKKKAFAL